MHSAAFNRIQWNLDIMNGQGPGKINVFAITRFRYIKGLFHIFFYYWGKKIVCYTQDFVI